MEQDQVSDQYSAGFTTQSTLLEVSNDYSSNRGHSPDISPKEEPLPQEPTGLTCDSISTDEPDGAVEPQDTPSLGIHPQFVPRPPSPIWRELEEASESSGSETSEFELLSEEESDLFDLSDEPDGEEPDIGRITKSMR